MIGAAVAGEGLGDGLDQQNASIQPVLDIVGSDIAHFPQVVLQVVAYRVALQVVVVEGEQGESRNHHQ